MARFYGSSTRTVDDKCRITIPTSFRKQLGDEDFVLAFGKGPYLTVFTGDDWEVYFGKSLLDDDGDAAQLEQLRLIAENIKDVRFDAQGRVGIPDKHREHASIREGAEVVIIGFLDRFEIWDLETRENFKK